MFPGPNAQIYRNEAGEVIGWDYPSEDDPYDPYEDDRDEPFECEECHSQWWDEEDEIHTEACSQDSA